MRQARRDILRTQATHCQKAIPNAFIGCNHNGSVVGGLRVRYLRSTARECSGGKRREERIPAGLP